MSQDTLAKCHNYTRLLMMRRLPRSAIWRLLEPFLEFKIYSINEFNQSLSGGLSRLEPLGEGGVKDLNGVHH